MSDYLGHSENPLKEEEWQNINETVIQVARRTLVGRRFIDLYGPLGAGVQTVPTETFAGVEMGAVDLVGEKDTARVHANSRSFSSIPLLYKDFVVHWRDLEAARAHNMPLDVSAAAGATVFCCQREDDLIFYGDEELGVQGLVNCDGRNTLKLGDWSKPGNAFQNIVKATEILTENDHFGPYALVVTPRLYSAMHRIFEKTGVLEIETVKKLCSDGVFRSNRLKKDMALVVSTGRENLDLAVAQDLTVAYLGAEKMNHPFRVVESVLPRIKHPDAICVIE